MNRRSGNGDEPSRQQADAELRRQLLDDPDIDPTIKAQLQQFQQQEEPQQQESRWPLTPARPRRKKLVLADASKPVTVLQRLAEVEEQTSVGEHLLRQFTRLQLRTALRIAALVVLLLGSLPLAAYLSPTFANLTVIGVRLPWLLLGVLPFPVLFGAGFWYHKLAERNERNFVNDVKG